MFEFKRNDRVIFQNGTSYIVGTVTNTLYEPDGDRLPEYLEVKTARGTHTIPQTWARECTCDDQGTCSEACEEDRYAETFALIESMRPR